jgi:hypothetical protein
VSVRAVQSALDATGHPEAASKHKYLLNPGNVCVRVRACLTRSGRLSECSFGRANDYQLSVCLSARNNSGCYWMDFRVILYWRHLLKSVQKI